MMTSGYRVCEGREIHYTEWGADLLLPEVAEEMRRRGPRATLVTVSGCGHAPALNVPEQFAIVERFLAKR